MFSHQFTCISSWFRIAEVKATAGQWFVFTTQTLFISLSVCALPYSHHLYLPHYPRRCMKMSSQAVYCSAPDVFDVISLLVFSPFAYLPVLYCWRARLNYVALPLCRLICPERKKRKKKKVVHVFLSSNRCVLLNDLLFII